MKKIEFKIFRGRYNWMSRDNELIRACISSFNWYFAMPKEVEDAYLVISTRPSKEAYAIQFVREYGYMHDYIVVKRRIKGNRWRTTALPSWSASALFNALRSHGLEWEEAVYVSVEYDYEH